MKRLEILVEEDSMKYVLENLLPKILPPDYVLKENCFIRAHDGKNDLKKSIPQKMKTYPHLSYKTYVLILIDQDSNDCKKLKNEINEITGKPNIPYMIRIVCKELENWYLGDLAAVESICSSFKASSKNNKSQFRKPDNLNGSDELFRLIPEKKFYKTQVARKIDLFTNKKHNKSDSFQHFIKGLQTLLSH